MQKLQEKSRLTPLDIENYVFQFSIEEITTMLIDSRKVITGAFWERSYDL